MEIKYLDDGRGVYVVEILQNGQYLIAEALFDIDRFGRGEDEYFPSSSLHVVDKVYDIPPKIKFSDEIVELGKSIESLTRQKLDIERNISNLKEKEKYVLDKLKNFDKLQYLLDFIDGKITHYVFIRWHGVEIVEYKDSDSDCSHDMKLLSLFGNTKGDISWKLNQYSDGSGCNTEVIPCLSYQMALEEAQKVINKFVAEKSNYALNTIKSAQKYNLNIPQEYIDAYRDNWNEQHVLSVAKKETEMEEFRNKKCEV